MHELGLTTDARMRIPVNQITQTGRDGGERFLHEDRVDTRRSNRNLHEDRVSTLQQRSTFECSSFVEMLSGILRDLNT